MHAGSVGQKRAMQDAPPLELTMQWPCWSSSICSISMRRSLTVDVCWGLVGRSKVMSCASVLVNAEEEIIERAQVNIKPKANRTFDQRISRHGQLLDQCLLLGGDQHDVALHMLESLALCGNAVFMVVVVCVVLALRRSSMQIMRWWRGACRCMACKGADPMRTFLQRSAEVGGLFTMHCELLLHLVALLGEIFDHLVLRAGEERDFGVHGAQGLVSLVSKQ